jgi:two-component system cell cycle response regulator DivK
MNQTSDLQRVLVVDDNDMNMRLFTVILEAHGYRTLVARDGKKGLALAGEFRPDLIIMDIQLPDMSGLEVTKLLKQDAKLRKIPVIAVTAFALSGDEATCREAGCDAYLTKPISMKGFLSAVEQLLRRGKARIQTV